MPILLPCYKSKQILMSHCFNGDISDEIIEQLHTTNLHDEIQFRQTNQELFKTNYKDVWDYITTLMSFKTFNDECVELLGEQNNEIFRFKNTHSRLFVKRPPPFNDPPLPGQFEITYP